MPIIKTPWTARQRDPFENAELVDSDGQRLAIVEPDTAANVDAWRFATRLATQPALAARLFEIAVDRHANKCRSIRTLADCETCKFVYAEDMALLHRAGAL